MRPGNGASVDLVEAGTTVMDLMELEATQDPIGLFRVWMKEAEAKEPNDPNAVALATATADGAPSVRMVLMKQLDERGFAFYTNSESRKGVELGQNPRAAMCFHWKSLQRQVRVEGRVTELPAAEADEYFQSRSRMSQLGAAASEQSRHLEGRRLLEERVLACEAQYPEEIPRPEYWKGYVLRPERVEFWVNGPDRLHDRFLFSRMEDGWLKERLFP
ncbi:MAG: Pyridoxamine 5-phosphate oxidase [Edaphobacter sp.]|nr:Pyridoxamine 5-phosphate oxidase [Edaphobacter sp.]